MLELRLPMTSGAGVREHVTARALGRISADLFSGALFLTQAIPNLSIYLAITILIATAAIFTITGGLTAVIWTDAVQTIVMIMGAFILMIKQFSKRGGGVRACARKRASKARERERVSSPIPVGGYKNLKEMFPKSVADTWLFNQNKSDYKYKDCGRVSQHYWTLMRPHDDSDLPWTGLVFGLTVSAVWYWCSDQVIVQRVLAAKILPPGLRGLILSVMMSALISSLTSVFNSTATIFTIDVWVNMRRHASESELMIVGRGCVVALVVISVIWVPVVQEAKELFHYIQGITSFLAPPVCAVFVLAVFWNRITEAGAFWGLMFGLLSGMVRFIWQYFFYPKSECGEKDTSGWPESPFIKDLHYLNFGAVLFGLVVVFSVIVSLLGAPPPESAYMGLTFSTRHMAAHMRQNTQLAGSGSSGSVEIHGEKRNPQFFEDILAGRTFDELPMHVKLCFWLCGIEALARKKEHVKQEVQQLACSLWEPPAMIWLLHLNGLLALTIITGLWAYYS
nr:hypothetical protein BaRGS_011040 [Batillaria attramentaria]